MQIINSKEELLDRLQYDDHPYDVNAHWCIFDMDYEYPIMLEYMGITNVGTAYRAYSRDDLKDKYEKIKAFMGDL